MKRVLTAAVLIPLVIIALFKAPLWLFTLLVLGVAVLAAHEYFGIVKAQGYTAFQIASYAFLALTFVVVYTIAKLQSSMPREGSVGIGMVGMMGLMFLWGLPIITLLAPLIFLLLALRREPLSQSLPDAAMSYMALPYVGFTLGLLPLLRATWNGALYLFCVMLLVWGGDTAAYYVGRAIGKHKLAPRVSPGKSWEGAFASVAAAMLLSWLLLHFLAPIATSLRHAHLLTPPTPRDPFMFAYSSPASPVPLGTIPLWLVLLFGAVVNIAAQLGDLVESALKRGAGVKDSGTLVPGHGGVLDRIDALLLALPVGLIFYLAGLSRYFAAV